MLVFDDLTQNKFEMVYEPLTLDTIGVVVEKIAKYHALSMVLSESSQRELVSQFEASFDAEIMRPMFQSIMTQAKSLGKAVFTWPGFEKIGSKIQTDIDTYFGGFADCYQKTSQQGLNVLNHGDFHIRNMMFRKDEEGALNEVTFLDFQIPVFLSPGFDLAYMMNAIGARDVRVEQRAVVLKMYHGQLVKSLALYGFTAKVPSLIDIHVEMLRIIPFGKET